MLLGHQMVYRVRLLQVPYCSAGSPFDSARNPFHSTVYGPLGFLAPLLLVEKRLLQEFCKGKVDWEDPIPDNVREFWLRWREELHLLENLAVPRCFKPEDFGTVTSTQLHHFSDASTNGYGQCSYIRLENDKGKIPCSLVLGKARVASLKMVTIPRLELTAAVVSVRVSEMLRQELQYEGVQEMFWTDSKVVLGYIKNDSKTFHVFVVKYSLSRVSNHCNA